MNYNKKMKAFSKKNKPHETIIVPQIYGEFNDFLLVSIPETPNKIEKETPKDNEEKKEDPKNKIIDRGDVEFFLSDFYPMKKNEKLSKSRFSDFFKEMEEENKNNVNKKPLSNSTKIYYPSSIKLSNSRIQNSENNNPTSFSLNTLDSYIIETKGKYLENNKISSLSNNETLYDSNNEKDLMENNSLRETIKSNEENNNNDEDLYEKFGSIVDMKKVLNLEDKRTTIMIKNIPNKFTRDMLINIINQNFRGTYDLFILPTDSNKFKNFGYAFINFTNSYYIPYFYYMFNGNMWSCTNSKKVCEITYSKIQGKSKLLKHYPSKIIYENEEGEIVNQRNEDINFIIPIQYKDMFLSLYPKQDIMVFQYYFLTNLPIIH